MNNTLIAFDLNGEAVREFNSITEASKELKLHAASIAKNLGGLLKTTGKLVFKYKDEVQPIYRINLEEKVVRGGRKPVAVAMYEAGRKKRPVRVFSSIASASKVAGISQQALALHVRGQYLNEGVNGWVFRKIK